MITNIIQQRDFKHRAIRISVANFTPIREFCHFDINELIKCASQSIVDLLLFELHAHLIKSYTFIH